PEPASAAPTPQSAAVPSQEDQLKAVRQACTINDFTAHCSWIAPTSPELLLCLKGNAAELSPACQSAVQSLPPPAAPAGLAAPPGTGWRRSPAGRDAKACFATDADCNHTGARRRTAAFRGAPSSDRTAKAELPPTQRHPRCLSIRFHGALLWRAAGRCRSTTVSAKKFDSAFGPMSKRGGSDRAKHPSPSYWGTGGCHCSSASCGSAWSDATHAPSHGARDFANLRQRPASTLFRC